MLRIRLWPLTVYAVTVAALSMAFIFGPRILQATFVTLIGVLR